MLMNFCTMHICMFTFIPCLKNFDQMHSDHGSMLYAPLLVERNPSDAKKAKKKGTCDSRSPEKVQ